MLNKAEERKSDLRNTTVMEVIIAVIIILLLVIYYKDTKALSSQEFYESQIVDLQDQNALLKKENREFKSELRELKKELEFERAKVQRLEKMFGPGGVPEGVEVLATQMDLLNTENRRLHKDIERLKKKLGGDGAGAERPRCRISLGEVPWLGDIYKSGLKFRFELAGKSVQRDALIDEIPGVAELVSKEFFARPDFEAALMKIYSHGERQDERCRFYVRVHRSKDFNLDDDLLIQKYLYRAIRNN